MITVASVGRRQPWFGINELSGVTAISRAHLEPN